MSAHTLYLDGEPHLLFALLGNALAHAAAIAGEVPDHVVTVVDADGRKRFDSRSVLVTVQLMILPEQARDLGDLVDSVHARLADEAGYLLDGEPITPQSVRVRCGDVEG